MKITKNIEILQNFTIKNIPNLDIAVLGALELFMNVKLPKLSIQFKKPLVVGSGNAAVTGKVLFADKDVILSDESNYLEKLINIAGIDGAILISASGSKHAIPISRELKKRGVKTILLTNSDNAPAKRFIDKENLFVFPKNREPYTYNASTYMGIIFGKTHEDPEHIYNFITKKTAKEISKDFNKYDAYYLLIPEQFSAMSEMFMTKFDEMFQPIISGRVFTAEQSKHAKSVVKNDQELFISFGYENKTFGLAKNRLNITLPKNVDYAGFMAIVYYVLGKVQESYPPYFQKGIVNYCKNASKIFGYEIKPIVE
ncbi:MAG: hypothetical protein AUJ23_01435 [Candidatus Magasanikbacteria bacterium CG1_02_32_51]|uniref:SIS domain-containing protein n=1 Tax=Candidatus Magasanikbacteria bacterium CG1_02_32_51 TaxID=1805238 RepID=A0A1J4U986_9BACT|nr:MAG: hypothetical protein AUJ23_01435 [Candidatus Magasanikbacteria bacterium CG1_02_32_51]